MGGADRRRDVTVGGSNLLRSETSSAASSSLYSGFMKWLCVSSFIGLCFVLTSM